MQVCVFVFDLLYVDGESLVHLPLRQRRARLAAALPNLKLGHVQFATAMEFQPAIVSTAAAAAAGSGAITKPATTAASPESSAAASAGTVFGGSSSSTGDMPAAADHGGVTLNKGVGSRVNVDDGNAADGNVTPHDGGSEVDIDATADAAPAAAAAAAAAVHATCMQQQRGGGLVKAAPPLEGGAQAADKGGGGELEKAGAAVNGAVGSGGAVSDLACQSIEDRIQEFLLESFAGGTEGLMLKALDVAAGYQPSKRSDSWIKLKRCCSSCNVHFVRGLLLLYGLTVSLPLLTGQVRTGMFDSERKASKVLLAGC